MMRLALPTINSVSVLGHVHVLAELVSSEPELGLKAEIRSRVRRSFRLRFGHWCQSEEVRSKLSAQELVASSINAA